MTFAFVQFMYYAFLLIIAMIYYEKATIGRGFYVIFIEVLLIFRALSFGLCLRSLRLYRYLSIQESIIAALTSMTSIMRIWLTRIGTTIFLKRLIPEITECNPAKIQYTYNRGKQYDDYLSIKLPCIRSYRKTAKVVQI